MIIRHSLPTAHFTRIDRRVMANAQLSDGAARLYAYFCGLRTGGSFTDKYVMKALGLSQAAITRRKRELKDLDLILMDQLSPRIYVMYVGYTGLPASKVKALWAMEDDKHEDEL